MSNILRSYRRSIAHRLMKEAGCVGINDGGHGNPSFFSLHWREYKTALLFHKGRKN